MTAKVPLKIAVATAGIRLGEGRHDPDRGEVCELAPRGIFVNEYRHDGGWRVAGGHNPVLMIGAAEYGFRVRAHSASKTA